MPGAPNPYGTTASPWPPYGAPPARPRRKVWPWVLGGVALLFVLVGVAGAIIIPKVIDSFSAPVDAANEYLHDVKLGGTATSYANLCSGLRSRFTYQEYRDELAAEADRFGQLQSYNANGSTREFDEPSAIVRITVTTSTATTRIEVLMVEENGHWRWCGARPASNTTTIQVPFF
jgi:hypothetical protein